MPDLFESYLVTLAGVALGQAAPGPNLAAVAGAALGAGRREAGFVALGVVTATFAWVAAAALGLAALLALQPPLLPAMKLLGGGYLCHLAARSLLAALRRGAPASGPGGGGAAPAFAAWRRGLLVSLTNPKGALLWSAVATFLYGSGLTAPQVLGFAPLGAASALLVYGGYGLLFSTGLARRAYGRFSRAVEGLFGFAFGLMGGKLVADGVREATSGR